MRTEARCFLSRTTEKGIPMVGSNTIDRNFVIGPCRECERRSEVCALCSKMAVTLNGREAVQKPNKKHFRIPIARAREPGRKHSRLGLQAHNMVGLPDESGFVALASGAAS